MTRNRKADLVIAAVLVLGGGLFYRSPRMLEKHEDAHSWYQVEIIDLHQPRTIRKSVVLPLVGVVVVGVLFLIGSRRTVSEDEWPTLDDDIFAL